MKHIRENDFAAATLQPELIPERQEPRFDPILGQVEFPINGLDRMCLKVVETHGKPVLVMERQRSDRPFSDWRPIYAFRISFAHAPTLVAGLGALIEQMKGE